MDLASLIVICNMYTNKACVKHKNKIRVTVSKLPPSIKKCILKRKKKYIFVSKNKAVHIFNNHTKYCR